MPDPTSSNQQVDDRAAERESPVRHAHAAAARRHGRASAPGYLGVPVGDPAQDDSDDREQAGDSDDRSAASRARSQRERGEGRAANGRGRSGRSPGRRETASRRSSGKSRASASKPAGAASRRSSGKSRASASKPASTASRRSSSKSRASASKSAGAAKSASRASKAPAGKRGGSKVRQAAANASTKAASGVAGKVASAAASSPKGARKRAAKELRRVVRRVAGEALLLSGDAAAKAVRQVGETGVQAVAERVNRLPIQRSIDVAVPVEVAWAQWMELRHLPEGANRVTEIERDGDALQGRIDGVGHGDWEAEILDERENESFAWRSKQGSDSAGLVTFHELSERLTRIELELDVRPVHLVEAATLALRVADRRVDSELRRFKAEAELLNPDCYDDLLSGNGSGRDADDGR